MGLGGTCHVVAGPDAYQPVTRNVNERKVDYDLVCCRPLEDLFGDRPLEEGHFIECQL